MNTDARREFVKLLVTRITMQPAIKGRAFNSDRLLVSGPGISRDPTEQGYLSQLIFSGGR
jgi:hypothetical protein